LSVVLPKLKTLGFDVVEEVVDGEEQKLRLEVELGSYVRQRDDIEVEVVLDVQFDFDKQILVRKQD
jgi:hypothetical protein